MKLPENIERDLREIEAEYAARGGQQAGTPRVRAIRASIEAELQRLTRELDDSNAVCACGCSVDAHENYGEDGESCEHEDHQCVRTNRAVLAMLTELRLQLLHAR